MVVRGMINHHAFTPILIHHVDRSILLSTSSCLNKMPSEALTAAAAEQVPRLRLRLDPLGKWLAQ